MGPSDHNRRRRRQWLIAIVTVIAAALCLTIFVMQPPSAPDHYEMPVYKPVPADADVRKGLDSRITVLDLNDVGFRKAIETLCELSGVKISVNWAALAKQSVSPETVINVRLKNVTLRKAIQSVLDDLFRVGNRRGDGRTDLRQVVENGCVMISSDTELAGHTDTRAYDISELVDLLAKSGILIREPPKSESGLDAELPADPDIVTDVSGIISETSSPESWRDHTCGTRSDGIFDDGRGLGSLVSTDALNRSYISEVISNLVQECVAFDSWSMFGGTIGKIRQADNKLIVTQTVANHEAITELLEAMRMRLKARSSETRPSEAPGDELLSGKIADIEFKNASLRKVIDYIRDKSGVNIHTKWRAIARESITPDTTINLRLKGMTTGGALRALCHKVWIQDENDIGPTELCYAARDGVITISIKDDLWRQMLAGVYDIRKIISLYEAASGGTQYHEEIIADIKSFIVDTISPGCSCGRCTPSCSTREIGGLLLVSYPAEHHDSLTRLLGLLQSRLGRRGPASGDDLLMLPGGGGAENTRYFRFYDVRDIIARIPPAFFVTCLLHDVEEKDPRQLQRSANVMIGCMISDVVDRESWCAAGGEFGRLHMIGELLGISHTAKTHDAIKELLGNIRRHLETPNLDARSYIKISTDRLAARQLGVRIPTLDLEDVTLGKAMLTLCDISGVNLSVDRKSFAVNPKVPYAKVNVYLRDVTFKEAIDAIFVSADRGYDWDAGYHIVDG
ncbi:MAG: hypothetical protein GY794_02710, partial [bacterium]|nr:hypothetical protein [bacterium]